MKNRTFPHLVMICLALILIPNVTGYTHASDANLRYPSATDIKHDEFDPSLYMKLQSIEALTSYLDQNFKGVKNSFEFVNFMAEVICKRFYHSFSFYTTNDNWVAGIAGKMIRQDLAAIVLPEDIMKFPNAACSQQSIVLMECARRYGLDYRTVGFDHHYAVEIRVKGQWHYIDTNIEVITKNESLQELIQSGRFYQLYMSRLPERDIRLYLAHPTYGKVNSIPAPQAAIFQRCAYWVSDYFICILMVIQTALFYLYLMRDKKNFPTMGIFSSRPLDVFRISR
ncbi:MAG: hypothetical protein ACJ75B_13965 [Flavisolibacter sp.]